MQSKRAFPARRPERAREKREMPFVLNQVMITDPTHDIQELQRDVNDKLGDCQQSIINSIDLYECAEGWFAVIWYKML